MLVWVSSWENAEGTALIRVGVQCWSGWSPRASTSRMISMLPPTIRGAKISKTDTSKFSEVEATTWASPGAPNSVAAQATKSTTLCWAMSTPLGRPVDPEV